MMVLSYLWGQAYLKKQIGKEKNDDMQLVEPIPYPVGRMLGYLALALGLYALSVLAKPQQMWLMYTLNTLYLLFFLAVAVGVEYYIIKHNRAAR